MDVGQILLADGVLAILAALLALVGGYGVGMLSTRGVHERHMRLVDRAG